MEIHLYKWGVAGRCEKVRRELAVSEGRECTHHDRAAFVVHRRRQGLGRCPHREVETIF